MSELKTTHLRPHRALLCFAGLTIAVGSVSIPMGCASASSRSDTNTLAEIDPAIAYAKRRHSEALEHYNTASALHLDGKSEEALAEYRAALELDNKLYAAWNNMGQLLMEQGQYADAVSAFKVASGLEVSDPRPEYNMGIAYQRVGWGQDAYKHFEAALERDPNYLPALRGVIRAAETLGAGSEPLLGYIRSAQLQETDEEWRSYITTQLYRVQALLKD